MFGSQMYGVRANCQSSLSAADAGALAIGASTAAAINGHREGNDACMRTAFRER
jgi:hypothetical protein